MRGKAGWAGWGRKAGITRRVAQPRWAARRREGSRRPPAAAQQYNAALPDELRFQVKLGLAFCSPP